MRNKMLFFVFLVSALVVLSGQVRAEGFNEGIRAGIAQCQNDPASCGINVTVNQDTNGSTQAGIAQCQNDPASCGINVTVNQDTNGSKQEGIDQCKADTVACGITNPNDYQTRKKTFDKDEAVKNAKADGKLAILDLKTKILHLPTVSVIYEQGNPVTYEQVHMSFVFTSQGKEDSFPHYLFQLNEATAAKP